MPRDSDSPSPRASPCHRGTAQAESNGGVRVMPLGDSITDGFNVPGGYRINLWQRLAGGGYTVDFVGSGFNGPAGLGDHDHEGHSGWRIDQIDANIVGWLQTANPHTILLHIGTNDMNQNYDVANAPARLSALIDQIRANAPTAELFVAQITPLTTRRRRPASRRSTPRCPASWRRRARSTHLVDMHSAITTADLADGVHPNATGYDKMAARWFTALQSVPGSLVPTVHRRSARRSLVNPQSARCLDVSGASTTAGARSISGTATAAPTSSGPAPPPGSCASTATAVSTSTATARPTARRSRSGPATATPPSGSPSTRTARSPAPAPASAST